MVTRELSNQLCECGCGKYTYIANYNDKRRGTVKGKPLRFRRGHNAVFSKQRPGALKGTRYLEEDRGWHTCCWIWQLSKSRGGYGKVRTDGVDKAAHRWYYERLVGAIPDGYQVDHLCGVRECVNPSHLRAVTPEENRWRMFMKTAGLTYTQIESLREWMLTNLSSEQIEKLWST